jgi:hypothetical protein
MDPMWRVIVVHALLSPFTSNPSYEALDKIPVIEHTISLKPALGHLLLVL